MSEATDRLTPMDAFDDLVGQARVVEMLRHTSAHAEDPQVMTHAWLFTGPAGSGRSKAAIAFAAELQAAAAQDPDRQRQLVAAGTHPDVTVLHTENVLIKREEVTKMLRTAQMSPSMGHWRIQIIEDADRMTESTSNFLLKDIEEPPDHTVWILCAPSDADLLPTIRSRARVVRLDTPTPQEVADLLVRRDGVDPERALISATVAQSHVGMARRLATDSDARQRRAETMQALLGITSLSAALDVSRRLLALAKDDAEALLGDAEATERARLLRQMGLGPDDRVPPRLRGQLREAEDDAKRRRKRALVDGVDRVLTDAQALLRDALLLSLGSGEALINVDVAEGVAEFAARRNAAQLLSAIDAIDEARQQLRRNVPPALALDAFLVTMIPGVLR